MNNFRPIIRSVVVLVACLFLATPAQAATLTLPQALVCAGLSFSSPLTTSSPLPTGKPLFVSFGQTPKANLLLTRRKQVLAASMTGPLLPTEMQHVLPTLTEFTVQAASPTPSPTPTDTPTPTSIPPTPTPTAVVTPAPTTNTVSLSTPGGLDADKLFNMVNAYRQSQGLPSFQKDATSCQLAASRAPEVGEEIADGHMHSGLKARNLPYWNTENIISYNSEAGAFNWWINDPIHHEAIVGNYTYSCLACSGNSCAEEFTNYQPK